MSKTPIKVALERQIPEYIRGEYELFVNFIKAYYEFLDQSQQRNLEDIRSIENTLEEFVVRFKKELSVLFPTNTLANERFILQKIREFYQARGSKESFQFLFKILFNKDADIFYPSTQILRASDGKWVQEKSVFVRSQAGDLFNLSGKMIKIQTGNKDIFVYCPKVVFYREGVYEVFINRSYIQDIFVGNTVKSEDNSDYGEIIRCPNKYTIVSKGAGFEVGQLLYLKTEKGDGSLIKITKIGTNGSIEKIQIISFGLDYESTFYAKLSNKQSVGSLFYSPVTIFPKISNVVVSGTAGQFTCTATTLAVGNLITISGTAGTGQGAGSITGYTNLSVASAVITGGDPAVVYKVSSITGSGSNVTGFTLTTTSDVAIATTVGTLTGLTFTNTTYNPSTTLNKYEDGINGFVDYGYINRQDYFYFDVNLPANQRLPGQGNISTVFYSDGTYAGEIIGSFYTNDTNVNVIDEDTAEIKIELGAVAIYPGYYKTSDGFISDESYIQDGKYYQLFSYVIRVEQQIDTYIDVVKQLLHPAGTELFAEFNIKNQYLLSASPLVSFLRLQFFDQEYISDDEGTNTVNLFIRRYLSNGNLSTETDPRRWSVVDALAPFTNNILNSDNKNDITLSIRKYDSNGTLITTETDQQRWSIIDPLAPFAHGVFNNGLGDAYVLNMGSFDPVTKIAIAPFVDSPTEAMGDFSKVEDFKIPTLSIRKYDSSGNLTGETDERRWSTVDALHTFPHDVNTNGQDNFYVVNLSIRRYDSDGNIITSETDQRRWSLVTPSVTVANINGAVRHFEISSVAGGTFYDSLSGISAFDSNRLAGTLPSGRPESERDRIVSTLLVRKYDSSGNLTGETDQRRWSTADAIHDFPHDVDTGGLDNFYKVDLSIRKYDSNGNDTGETDTRRWSLISSIDLLNRDGNPDLGSGFRVTYDRSTIPLVSLDPATPEDFYRNTITLPKESLAPAIDSFDRIVNYDRSTIPLVSLDPATPEEVLDRTVTYDRSTIPLLSLDPAIPQDIFANNVTLPSAADLSTPTEGFISGYINQSLTPAVNNTKFLISPEYYRAPQLTLTGTVVAGSNVMTLTGTSTTNGVQNGRILTKVSGTGELGAGQVRVEAASVLNSLTTFTMHTVNANTGVSTPAPASVTGTIVFTLSFETPELAQFVDTPVDSFPDGSTFGVVKFLFSSLNSDGTPRTGGTWADFPIPQVVLDRTVVYDRSTVPLVSLDPATASEGGRTFALDSLENDRITPRNGGTWTDLLSSPTDNRSGSKIEPFYVDTINNSNTGTFYYNVYNQDTSDPLSSFSYFAEGYAEVITRALS